MISASAYEKIVLSVFILLQLMNYLILMNSSNFPLARTIIVLFLLNAVAVAILIKMDIKVSGKFDSVNYVLSMIVKMVIVSLCTLVVWYGLLLAKYPRHHIEKMQFIFPLISVGIVYAVIYMASTISKLK